MTAPLQNGPGFYIAMPPSDSAFEVEIRPVIIVGDTSRGDNVQFQYSPSAHSVGAPRWRLANTKHALLQQIREMLNGRGEGLGLSADTLRRHASLKEFLRLHEEGPDVPAHDDALEVSE